MGRQLAKYGFLLIGGYVVATQWTGTTKVITSGAAGGTSVIKTLQGR
jgi:hypothetical protein